jgi:hypothetical protein
VVTALGATVAPGPANPADPANPAHPANPADRADAAEPPKRNPPATDDPLG